MRVAEFNAPAGGSRRLLILMHVGFVATGVMTTFIGPLLPALSTRWSLTDAQAGDLITAQFVGSMAGVALSGILTLRRGFKFPIALGFACMCLAAIGLIAGSWKVALALFFLNGAGLGLVIPSTNLMIAETNPNNASAALNLLNFSWGAGATICPFLVHTLTRTGGISAVMAMLALLSAVLAVTFLLGTRAFHQRTRISVSGDNSANKANSVRFVFLLGAMFFLYLGTESAVGEWIASYTKRIHVSQGDFWMLSPSFFWGALLAGRASAPIWLRWVAEIKMARIGVMLALGGIGILLQASTPVGIAAGASVAGFGLAPVYPITIAMLTKECGAAASRISGLLFALAGMGGATMPWLVGLVSTHFGDLKIGLLIPLFSAGIMVLLYFQRLRTRPENKLVPQS
jgi:FHS family glucose/mannose:H+ symporter-like MFS transporter